jgi:transposase
MAYTSNPNLPKVRWQAVRLVKQGWTTRQVARHLGYNQSSVVRWCQRADQEQLAWNKYIQTKSSRPKSHPRALSPEIVEAIIAARLKHGRCGEVVWRQLSKQGIEVSLASVNRTLKRHELVKPISKWKRFRPPTPRPYATSPGVLIQADTIHFVRPDGR